LRMMRREWQALGHAEPVYTNDRARKAFELFLPDEGSRRITDTTPEVTGEVAGEVERVIRAVVGEMSRMQIQTALGLKGEEHFRSAYLKPALTAGVIEMTLPDKPTSRMQRYRLTELGKAIRQRSMSTSKDHDPGPTDTDLKGNTE